MKLLVDMNLSPRWVSFLSEAGMEAVHWTAVGRFDALIPKSCRMHRSMIMSFSRTTLTSQRFSQRHAA